MSHTLHLRIIEGRNLKAADSNGFSDPYVKLLIHDKKELKTKIIKKSLNPKWDEVFHIEGLPEKGSFVIQVWDWDMVGSDDFLGSGAVPYSSAIYSKAKERWINITDEDGSQGDVHIVLQVIPKGYKADLENIATSNSRLTFVPEVTEGNGQLVVEVVKASNLPPKDLNGFSDPYCVLKVGKTEYKTNIIERTLHPIWNEEFYYDLQNLNYPLVIELYDYDRISSHDKMGCVKIDLKTLFDEKFHTKSYQIEAMKKEKVSGELFLRLQYTSPQNAQKNTQIAKREYFKLVQVLVIKDVSLLVNLLNLYESQELARAIVHLFGIENRVISFFSETFKKEVKGTISENTLLRTDCASTKASTAYFKYVDSHVGYLSKTIFPLINLVQTTTQKDPLTYETDNKKGESDAVCKARERNLYDITQRFLDAITDSRASFPPQFSEVLYCLKSIVTTAFPGSELKAVNCILFLRFICPAIFSPESFGLLQSPLKQDTRRALTLIAKTLQTVVNSSGALSVEASSSSSKQSSKASLLTSIDASRLNHFLESVSKKPSGDFKDGFEAKDEERYKCMETVVKNLRVNYQKLQEYVFADPRLSTDPALAAELRLQVDEIGPIVGE